MKKSYIHLITVMVMMTQPHYAYTRHWGIAETAGAVATAVLAGVGLAKLADWCFSETNQQLLERGKVEYDHAMRYKDIMYFFEESYGATSISSDNYHYFKPSFSEPILYSIATRLFEKGISQSRYAQEVDAARYTLKALSEKLRTRIKEKKDRYLDKVERQELDAMKKFSHKLDTFLNRFNVFADYLQEHKEYLSLYEYEAYLYKHYEAEMRIAKAGVYAENVAYDLRKEILWRYSDNRYPFNVFIKNMTDNIARLRSHINMVSSKYTERLHYARLLQDQLAWIRQVATNDPQYAQELQRIEQERIEQLRLEVLHEQARIERNKLREMERYNDLVAENNVIARQQLYHDMYADQQKDVAFEVSVTVNK
jgi:hypothetical protein